MSVEVNRVRRGREYDVELSESYPRDGQLQQWISFLFQRPRYLPKRVRLLGPALGACGVVV